MTTEEKTNYYSQAAKRGKERFKTNVIANKKKEVREDQVLIRLTASERLQLERDAKQENIPISSLIRNRALQQKSQFDIVIQHLKKIESQLKK
jgi:hypothetical protein